MNRFALAAALAASLSTFAFTAAPAAAEDVSVTVAYGDLDLATPAGAQSLAGRFAAGVDTACARPDFRDLKAMTEFDACRSAAVASATQQLNTAGVLFGASRLAAQG